MDIALPARTTFLRLAFATALVALSLSIVTTLTGFAAAPVMQFVERRANSQVDLAVAMLNGLIVCVILFPLTWLARRAEKGPATGWRRNGPLFAASRVVALFYLAGIVIGWIGGELRGFIEIPVGNATQLDMFSFQGRLFLAVVLPAIGVAILVWIAPRLLGGGR